MRKASIVASLVSLFLALIVWVMFAPAQLGGQVTYVIVDGNSMEPNFQRGDLLLIRNRSDYGIGDAVTYRDADLGKFVFHRIIDLSLDRFVLQGDNNTWMDTYQPTREDIVGKLWVHIPKLGKAIEWLRLPVNLAIAVALLGGSLMYGMIQPDRKGEKKKKVPANSSGNLEYVFYATGFFVLLFVGICVYGFTRPLITPVGSVSYQHEGNFYYSAAGAPGIYDTDKVRSGEPIFPKLTCYLNIGYSYNLSSAQVQEVSGSHQLIARVIDEKSGWQRTLPMTSENVFNGSTFLAMSTLDLCQVQALVDMVEQETGLHENTYTLEIVAHAAVAARIAGNTVNETFEPTLRLKFDDVHFYIASNGGEQDLLKFSQSGLVESTELQPNTVSILGFRPTVQSLRMIGLGGLFLTLAVVLGAGWIFLHGKQNDRDAVIRLKYGGLLMDVQEYALTTTSPLVDVNTIDDLARLAERQNTMILHMTNSYLVQAQGITYRYGSGKERDSLIGVQPARRQILDGIGRSEKDEDLDKRMINDAGARRDYPVSTMEFPQKIVLRYSLNASGNADLNFDTEEK
jgi:signal peptidase I